MTPLAPEFSFAGFTWPRYIPQFSRSKYDKRTFRATYYHAPKPLVDGSRHPGQGFYLDSEGSPDRWQWCDHTGWFCDEYQDEKSAVTGSRYRMAAFLPVGVWAKAWRAKLTPTFTTILPTPHKQPTA